MRRFIFQALVVIVCVVILAEIILRYRGMYATYAEANAGTYVTEYGQTYPSWYHSHNALDTFTPDIADFHFTYTTNSLGIRDGEHELAKPDSIFRIAIFGDSYAEGVGAPIDSNWASLLQKYVSERSHLNVEVINGGVSGCDPYFSYVMYRDKISKYKPDLVIVTVNATDYSDIMLRGGMERFKSNGTTHYKDGPWYEPIFEHSRFFRAVLHKVFGFDLTGIFISRYQYKERLPSTNSDIAKLLGMFKDTVQARDSKFALMLYTIPPEIVYKKHKITEYNTQALGQLSNNLRNDGFETIDLRNELFEQYSTSPQQAFTYVSDLHYRPCGYSFMANLIADTLIQRGCIGNSYSVK